MFEEIKESADFLIKKTGFKAKVGVVLGTGLGGLVNEVKVEFEIPYSEIPNFPLSTVESHSGKLIFGSLAGVNVIVMQGRFHYYEGYSMEKIGFPIRVMKLLGIEQLYISNAAGGINPSLNKGDLMIIEDHINHFPTNPLIGKNLDQLGDRFPDMSEVYQKEIISDAEVIGKEFGLKIKKGVYVGLSGPMLETPAEYKYLGIIGADVVGMSTIPEVIAAKHMGLDVFACSIITDVCYGEIKPVNIQEIIKTAMEAEPALSLLFKELIKSRN